MKTLHILIIFVSILFVTIFATNLPASHAISGLAYFMKSNSTAKIYADFTIHTLSNQSFDIRPEILASLDDLNTRLPGLFIDAKPNSFVKNMHHMHVTYTITAKDNSKGVYPVFLYLCGTAPLVVGLNESEVSSAIYNKFFTTVYSCPAASENTPYMNVIGYSGIISKTLSIDSNNTVTVIHVDTLGLPLQTPLKQFKAGTLAKDVRCRIDLQLIIKEKDGSPACVTQDTANTLAKRGWSRQIAFELNITSNHAIDIVSIKSVPPVNPGGPAIELTLKNSGTTPITNLKAMFQLNNNYTFDFNTVTPSNPLAPGDSISDTQILIGAGFRSESSYPLVISGIENDMLPFRHSVDVNMP